MGKGARTKQAILDEGLSLTSRLGLEGLSIGSLAHRTGMSKSGLFAHFSSKEDLQRQILETGAQRFIEEVIAPALAERRGVPRIRAFFQRWLEWAERQTGGCVFIAVASELDDRPGPLRDLLVAKQKDWLDVLATAARIAVEEGQLRDDLDPDEFAYRLYSIYLAHHHFSRLMRDPTTHRRTQQAFEDLLAQARA